MTKAKCSNIKLQQPTVSYGRRRRSPYQQPANVTEVSRNSSSADEIGLSDEIIVAEDFDPFPDPLRAGSHPDTLLIVEPGKSHRTHPDLSGSADF